MDKRYGQWAGDPKGKPEDKTRCIAEVFSGFGGFIAHQCQRKRGYGTKGLYCKQHAKQALKD